MQSLQPVMTKFKVSHAHFMEQDQRYVTVMSYLILVNFKSQQVQSHEMKGNQWLLGSWGENHKC